MIRKIVKTSLAVILIFTAIVLVATYCTDDPTSKDYSSLNVSGTVAPGSYLSLKHNLGREDLTFTAQYVKDGFIYDYTEYQGIFVPIKSPTPFESATTTYISSTQLKNGNFVIAYRDEGNSFHGTFIIYNANGDQVIAGPTVFEEAITTDISIAVLNNGSFVIAYRNDESTPTPGYGTFVIYDASGDTVIAGPVEFESSATSYISVSVLNNGNFVIAYNAGSGKFAIYNAFGTKVTDPAIEFDSDATSYISANTLSNDNFVIAYSDSGSSNYGTLAIYSESGSEIKSPTPFEGASTSYISTTPLCSGNFVIAYNAGSGKFVIYNNSGVKVTEEPIAFKSTATTYISTITLSNDNFVIAYPDSASHGTFIVYNPSGYKVIAGPIVFESGITSYISSAALSNRRFVIAYRDEENSNYGTLAIYGESHLALQKFSDEEVRLWNFTCETLELMLSVNQ
jgi:hypothetical protein